MIPSGVIMTGVVAFSSFAMARCEIIAAATNMIAANT